MSRARDKSKKKGSLKHQIHLRMEQLKCIGESRHEAKKEYVELYPDKKNRNKTVGIHSYQTYNNYKSTMIDFGNYIRKNYKVKNIEDITEEMAINYIKYRADEGYSSSTYSKDMAAINKVFNFELDKKKCEVENRSYTKISNNRDMKEHHKKINYDNYTDEIDMITATGMRRHELLKAKASDFNYDSQGNVVSVNIKGKGGKERVSSILNQYRDRVKAIVETRGGNDKLFDKIPGRLGTHRFRQDYARNMYNEVIANGYGNGQMYRGYDAGAIAIVSRELGHNRLDVVVYNYLKPTEDKQMELV